MTPHQRLLRIQPQLRQSPQNHIECDLALQSGQGCAETKVRGPTECQMLVVLSCDIQPIGFRKSFRIAVASPHYRDYSLTLSNELSSQIDIRGSQSRGVLTGTLVTQQ